MAYSCSIITSVMPIQEPAQACNKWPPIIPQYMQTGTYPYVHCNKLMAMKWRHSQYHYAWMCASVHSVNSPYGLFPVISIIQCMQRMQQMC